MTASRDSSGRFVKGSGGGGGGVKIKDTDRGFAALRKRIAEAAKGAGVSVGVHAAEGAEQHKGEEPVSLLDVAIWNELGIGVPERSFIRAWFDEANGVNRELLRRALVSVVKGQRTLPQALELVGLKFQGEVQKKIAAGVPPPNAPSTIAQKGSSTPLIDTGQLRQSITFVVHGEPKPQG